MTDAMVADLKILHKEKMNDWNALKCNTTSVWGIIKSRKKVVKHILKETQKIKFFFVEIQIFTIICWQWKYFSFTVKKV